MQPLNSPAAPPKVSVFMMAYNHAPYITQALDSALAQQTNFSVQIVVGEDNSPDGTRAIVTDYARRYPGRIVALLHETNLGASLNQQRVLEACTGHYLAFLEGDDYWTDPHKLQRQVDFLEQHPDYVICFHNGIMVAGTDPRPTAVLYSTPPPDTITVAELADNNCLYTVTCMYRNFFSPYAVNPMPLPAWLRQSTIGDYCLHLLIARRGKIKYLPLSMAAYRTHAQGTWSLQSLLKQNVRLFDTIELVKSEFSGEVHERLGRQQLRRLAVIAEEAEQVPEFDFQQFLHAHQTQILSLIAADFGTFMQHYFAAQRAICSAEHRWATRLTQPLRRGLNWFRKRK